MNVKPIVREMRKKSKIPGYSSIIQMEGKTNCNVNQAPQMISEMKVINIMVQDEQISNIVIFSSKLQERVSAFTNRSDKSEEGDLLVQNKRDNMK